jgi:predicted acetylornithine/succinylornithine family transaminase
MTNNNDNHLLQNYRSAPITIVRGEGCYLFDDKGTRYLDMIGGIAVCALGHAHPGIAEAISKQAHTLVQSSNLFGHEPARSLANELAKRSGFDRVFFCNSGAEANEAAIKLARKFAFRKGDTKRRTILSCNGSFHGRTLGALAATPNEKYQEGFDPLPGGFRYTPFNDAAALEKAIDDTVAAFIVEPIQGESGIISATREFLEASRRLCSQHGALLIFDEIQCGMGRIGPLFAFQYFGVRPDVVTIAKALANGLPIGAMLLTERVSSGLQPGDHGTTFGGSPVPCAAGLAHLRIRDEIGLQQNVERMSEILFGELRAVAREFPDVLGDPRGAGLLAGLPVKEPHDAATLVTHARERSRVLLNKAGNNTLRFAPPLIVTEEQIVEAMKALCDAARSLSVPVAAK